MKNGQRVIMMGLLCETEIHKRQLYEGFKDLGYRCPVVIGSFETLPGHGGEGGRSDTVIEIDPKDVGKYAVSSMHLSGECPWVDDYVAHYGELIPEEAKKEYFSNEEFAKPECQLVGQDGNVFNIIGLVKRALVKAGYQDKAKEFVEKAIHADSYDAVLVMSHEYCEISEGRRNVEGGGDETQKKP